MMMSARIMEAFVPFFALAFMAVALFRLARTGFAGHTIRLKSPAVGPSILIAALEMLCALFLVIPNTQIWGLFLGTVIGSSYGVTLWKKRRSILWRRWRSRRIPAESRLSA
jgi:hypothetical protein